MPEGVGYGPQNTASTGLSLNIVGNYCYAYSGSTIVNNDTVTALSFESGNYVINGQVQLTGNFADMAGSKKIGMIVKFNGQTISTNVRLNVATNSIYDLDALFVLIPPFTSVTVEITTDNAGNIDYYATLTGRIYGKVE